ncbi:hypothetical protein HPB47_002372 [Ixodes persulcatus]|uniref:Uncharacterized protein n=1 Tax=Ixodes persulcatus TaxID=34615 RepID=A0AC60PLK8_IXOPE|nr:hypothetical protein HPB47_002372 [Ixodes persulcatus]
MDSYVPAMNTAPSPRIQKRQDGKVLNGEERLFMFLSSDVNRVYCDFLLSVIPEFEKTTVLLQSGAPQIHLLREILHNLLRDLILRFVKPSVIKRTDVLKDINYKSFDNQRDNEDTAEAGGDGSLKVRDTALRLGPAAWQQDAMAVMTAPMTDRHTLAALRVRPRAPAARRRGTRHLGPEVN